MADLTVSSPVDTFMGAADQAAMRAALGLGTADSPSLTALTLTGATSLLLGTEGSLVGSIGFRNATSGTATLAPPTGALGAYTVTLPGVASTLATLGANTFTAAQTITEAVGASALTLTGATQTSSFPVLNMTQTWNNSLTTFTGISFVVTRTAAAAASRILDIRQSGAGILQFNGATGELLIGSYGNTPMSTAVGAGVLGATGGSLHFGCHNGNAYIGNCNTFGADVLIGAAGFKVRNGMALSWSSDNTSYGTADAAIYRDAAAGVIAQRNSSNAQTFRVYGTADAHPTLTNYVRASLAATSTTVTLAAETAGTGADNVPINITTVGTGLTDFTNQAASTDAAVVSTHTARMKFGGVEYKILLATP